MQYEDEDTPFKTLGSDIDEAFLTDEEEDIWEEEE